MADKAGNKTGGRKPGTPNKTQAQLRSSINFFISKNWRNIQKNYNKLDPKDKLAFMEKLMKYVVPSLSNVSATIDYSKLSDEDLDNIINKLKKS